MARSGYAALALMVLLLAGAVPAGAQSGISINPYIGYYHFDESSFEDAFDEIDLESKPPLLGVRLGLGDRDGASFDVAYGNARVEGQVFLGNVLLEEDSNVHLFYGALVYQLPLPGIGLFASAGAGAVRYDPQQRDTRTDAMVNFGGGIAIPVGRFRLRADVKDHMQLCEAPDSDDLDDFGACFDDETLHNIEISAGADIAL